MGLTGIARERYSSTLSIKHLKRNRLLQIWEYVGFAVINGKSVWGTRGRRFESGRSDHLKQGQPVSVQWIAGLALSFTGGLRQSGFSLPHSELTTMVTVLPILVFLAAILVLNKTQTGHFF